MNVSDFFQLTPIPPSAMTGSYNLTLVALSYLIASLASFVALDITERIRTSGESMSSKIGWLVVGAIAMGMGIWTMHFIGMLAFIMPMKMDYDFPLTALSLVIAIIASAFAFFLIKNDKVKPIFIAMGGVLLGLGIVSMHYTGMTAMLNVTIHYIPSIFLLSIGIAIIASEAALLLMIKSSNTTARYHAILKLGSALIMGLAVCGMHYTGMAAAVFTHDSVTKPATKDTILNIESLSFFIGATTIVIMIIAIIASRFWMYTLQSKNKKLLETEAILEQKSEELQRLNENLLNLAEISIAKEEKISAILTAAADGIIVTDKEGVIEICNRAACKIFGCVVEDILSQNINTLIKFLDPVKNIFYSISLPFLAEKGDVLFELFGVYQDNKMIPLELAVSTLTIKNNIFYILIFRDITGRKEAEQQLAHLNSQLVSTARLAGMAEVATGVLHNVGNVFTSINVSAQLLLERDFTSHLSGLKKLVNLLNTHKSQLDVFVTQDSVGKMLPQYLEEFSQYLENEFDFIHKELESLNTKVQHVKSVIIMQQSLGGSSNMIEKVFLNKLLDDALAINSEMIEKYEIIIEKEYDHLVPFNLDKVKIMQTLINLIKNAVDAVIESNQKEKKIILRAKMVDSESVKIEIIDNGIGIKPEDITKIFSYGFTTKEKGHGFGLHTSSLSIQEMGGSLKAYSLGPNQGATFVLILPKQ